MIRWAVLTKRRRRSTWKGKWRLWSSMTLKLQPSYVSSKSVYAICRRFADLIQSYLKFQRISKNFKSFLIPVTCYFFVIIVSYIFDWLADVMICARLISFSNRAHRDRTPWRRWHPRHCRQNCWSRKRSWSSAFKSSWLGDVCVRLKWRQWFVTCVPSSTRWKRSLSLVHFFFAFLLLFNFYSRYDTLLFSALFTFFFSASSTSTSTS